MMILQLPEVSFSSCVREDIEFQRSMEWKRRRKPISDMDLLISLRNYVVKMFRRPRLICLRALQKSQSDSLKPVAPLVLRIQTWCWFDLHHSQLLTS